MKDNCILNTYFRTSVKMIRGKGVFLYDDQNKGYLDFSSGIAVNNLGHSHPELKQALEDQSSQLWHCSNLFEIPEQQKLAASLTSATFADKVFFCSSGLEAAETAIKLIRKNYYHNNSNAKFCHIITLQDCFHGRSIAAISAKKDQKSECYRPLLKGFKQIPRNNIRAFEQALDSTTAGIILEPVQSEGGVFPLDLDYMNKVREITSKRNIIMCLDEVQTGYGRTSKLFAHEELESPPDIMTIAKGMGNGFPVGACLMTEKIAEVISPGDHGSTYGGNPLAMRVASKVLEIISEPGFLNQVKLNANYLESQLKQLKALHTTLIREIRHKGMMSGIELNGIKAIDLLQKCLSKGLVTTKCGAGKVLRLLPPLIIEKTHTDLAVSIIDDALRSCNR